MARVQSLREMMESLVATPGVKRLSGTIQDPQTLLASKSIEALDARHAGSFVFFVYNPAVDDALSKYLESGALANDTGSKIFAMYESADRGVHSNAFANIGLSNVTPTSPVVEFINAIFEGKAQALPGMLPIGRLSTPSAAVYISLTQIHDEHALAERVREVLRLIADATNPNSKDVLSANDLGSALGIRNIPHANSGPITIREGFARMLGFLWAHKSDVIAVVSAAVKIKTGG